ncbi:hypothetical protein N665_0172s0059 [Sinapis alba]|nr:hypothetical protein N665_0172s0059 [Sinapis alba]
MSTYSYISELNPIKVDWKIKIKIIHRWTQYSPILGETIELVLCDQLEDMIHATIDKELVARFDPYFREGYSRVITNFVLTPPIGAYRVTRHAYKIKFLSTTHSYYSEPLPTRLTGFQPVDFTEILRNFPFLVLNKRLTTKCNKSCRFTFKKHFKEKTASNYKKRLVDENVSFMDESSIEDNSKMDANSTLEKKLKNIEVDSKTGRTTSKKTFENLKHVRSNGRRD